MKPLVPSKLVTDLASTVSMDGSGRSKPRRYVMLDRDGTIIVERNYLSDPKQLELLPGAAEGLRLLSQLGLGLLVVTNQSGIGRKYFDEARLAKIHERMNALLAVCGVRLDGIFVCPHTPKDGCGCRKPHPGLVPAAAAKLGFDPAEGFLLGDKPCDIELGHAVGARTFLVRTGYGAKHERDPRVRPDFVAEDLLDAAKTIRQIVSNVSDGDSNRTYRKLERKRNSCQS